MTNRYVAKDGNDANDGSTWALAKLTIQAGVNLIASGDTLYIGAGVYNETITRTMNSTTATIQGVGLVIVDGGGTISTNMNCGPLSGTLNLTINDIVFQNHTSGACYPTANTNVWTFNRCRFVGNGYGILLQRYPNITVANCIFANNSIAGIGATALAGGYSVIASVSWCTFVDNIVGILTTTTNPTITSVKHNVFVGNTLHWSLPDMTSITTIDYNDIWFDGVSGTLVGSTSDTTFSGWKTTSSKDANSVSEDPIFQDRTRKSFGLHKTSPLWDDINEVGTYGAGHMGQIRTVGMSYGDLDGNYANAIMVDCQKNESNNFDTTSATSGTVRTGVIDMGSAKLIRYINIQTNLDKNRYPLDVPDYDIADADPRTITIRWRGSLTSFANDDVVPAWTEIEPSVLGEDVNTICRYVQVETTLRRNGA
jgi:hypothetical protein